MTKKELEKKANRLLAIGIQMESLIRSLPPGVVCNYISLSREFSSAISQIERAAAQK